MVEYQKIDKRLQMSKKCLKELKSLIEEIVLPDIEDYIDDIFEEIAGNKNVSDNNNHELENMQEMRKEFYEILKDIKENNLTQEECSELLEEIKDMIKEGEN